MELKLMAIEYQKTAQCIGEKIATLKQKIKEKNALATKNAEERILVLQAEYLYLLKTAFYLENYYETQR